MSFPGDLSAHELATILGALRAVQAQGFPNDIEDIATAGSQFDLMTDDQIDDLCAKLNGEAATCSSCRETVSPHRLHTIGDRDMARSLKVEIGAEVCPGCYHGND